MERVHEIGWCFLVPPKSQMLKVTEASLIFTFFSMKFTPTRVAII